MFLLQWSFNDKKTQKFSIQHQYIAIAVDVDVIVDIVVVVAPAFDIVSAVLQHKKIKWNNSQIGTRLM